MLQDEKIVEKQRGKGLFVLDGAQEIVLDRERENFPTNKWPAVLEQIKRLNLSVEQLLPQVNGGQ